MNDKYESDAERSDGCDSDDEENDDFVKDLEKAERDGKLPYKCPHCDFTTTMITGVFYHRAEDCEGIDFCCICGDISPDVFHYLKHGFECLSQGCFDACGDKSTACPMDFDSEAESTALNTFIETIDLAKD